VSNCQGFEELLDGFSNPTQFEDSMFEAQMARWCLERPAVRRLRFAPTYAVMGHSKRPDFEIFTSLGRIVCECKRAHQGANDFSKRLARITDAFDVGMKSVPFTSGLRLEVEVHDRIVGDLTQAANQACAAAAAAPVGKPFRFGPFTVATSKIGEPAVHKGNWKVQTGKVEVGDTPTGITEEWAYLLVASPRMEQALIRGAGSLINTAHRQLPSERNGIVFVSTNPAFGKPAATARLSEAAYLHCLAIATVGSGTIEFARRNVDESAIQWIFCDQPPSLYRRLRLAISHLTGLRQVWLHARARQ
jgi:hypothetical protein